MTDIGPSSLLSSLLIHWLYWIYGPSVRKAADAASDTDDGTSKNNEKSNEPMKIATFIGLGPDNSLPKL